MHLNTMHSNTLAKQTFGNVLKFTQIQCTQMCAQILLELLSNTLKFNALKCAQKHNPNVITSLHFKNILLD